MSAEDVARNEHAETTRATAPVSGISLPAHLGTGGDLVDSIDYVVWIQVMFDVSSGKKVTPILVWQRLQGRGIRSTKNRNELVGKNTVYEAFARIIEAGYFRRYEKPNEKHPGRKGAVAYEVYDNPAWNPDWQVRQVGSDPLHASARPDEAQEKPQVGTLPGTREAVDAGLTPSGETAGQNASRNQGSVVPGSGVPGSGKRRVPAGQNASPVPGRIEPSPPYPPEEEDSSSPYPLTDGARPHPSQREEGAGVFSKDETDTAERFLQQMKRWQAGAATARKCAPRLLRAMREQGWPTLTGMDDEHVELLEAEILKNTGGAKSWTKCLPGWVDDLRLYDRVQSRRSSQSAGARERCPDHPARYRTGCIDCAMAVPA